MLYPTCFAALRARNGVARPLHRIVALIVATVLVGTLLARPAAAETPPESPAPAAPELVTLASGLVNPRGIAFGPDGALYIAEAGNGGAEPPANGHRRMMIGHSSRVSRVTLEGEQTTVLDNLPSLLVGDDELGAADVAFIDQTLYVLTAAGGLDTGDPDFDNVVLSVPLSEEPPVATRFFNLTEYNLANPSLTRQQDPVHTQVLGGMPFGLAALDGVLYATDGNQEHVTRIMPDGTARRILEYPMSNRVLTGITAGPDGMLYVAEFGPIPHKKDSSKVTRLSPEGIAGVVTDRLVDAIDVAFDAAGRMYILEFAGPGIRVPESGRVLRVGEAGALTVIVDKLNFPSSFTFGPDGRLYIAVSGHYANDGTGRIVSLDIPD
ncbi:MAG: ScyD/ScyE family protein [Chloroflexota bacterium]